MFHTLENNLGKPYQITCYCKNDYDVLFQKISLKGNPITIVVDEKDDALDKHASFYESEDSMAYDDFLTFQKSKNDDDELNDDNTNNTGNNIDQSSNIHIIKGGNNEQVCDSQKIFIPEFFDSMEKPVKESMSIQNDNEGHEKFELISKEFCSKDLVTHKLTTEIIVECTLLLDKDKPCVTYKNTFFRVGDICQIIQNSIQRVVINCVAIRSMHSFSQCDFVSTEQDVEMTHQIQQQQRITTDLSEMVRNGNSLPSQGGTITANNSNTYGFGNLGSENHINGWI